jgi:putative tryptophan/tyrosine transport system substrate-binding protein
VKRREFIGLLAGAATAWPLGARAQQNDHVRRIGFLMPSAETDTNAQSRVAAFRKGLQQLGWTEGRNIRIDYRWADDSGRIGPYAEELVRLSPDVILANGNPVVAAVLQQTRTVPIVFVQVADPVGSGFIQSLARPGGNITGLTNFELSMAGKWLELLKEIAPTLTRVAVILHPETAAHVAFPRYGTVRRGGTHSGRRARRCRDRGCSHYVRSRGERRRDCSATSHHWKPPRRDHQAGTRWSLADDCTV